MKMRIKIFLILFTIILNSCRKEKTSWDSNWKLPLIEDSLNLSKYINDSTIQVNSSGQLVLGLRRNLFNFNLSEVINIPDTTITKLFVPAFTSLTVPPGYTFINDINENDLKIDDIELKIVELRQGFIDVTLKNPVETSVIFKIDFPGITKNGVQLSEEITAPAGTNSNPGVVSKTFNLAGYRLDLRGSSGNSFNVIQTKLTVKSNPIGPSVIITNQQTTEINAKFRDASFSYARGYFGQQNFKDTSETVVEFLKNIQAGMVDISNTTVKFIIKNGIKAPAKSKLILASNLNTQGNEVSLTHPQIGHFIPVNAANVTFSSFSPSETTYEFNSNNSNIEDFIENLGYLLKYAYDIQLNPNGNDSGGWNEIFEQSAITLDVVVETPLEIGVNGLVLQDTFDLSFENNEKFFKIKNGTLEINAVNAFPLSANLKLTLLDQNNTVISVINPSNIIQSSEFGTEMVNGLLTAKSKILVNVDNETSKDFKNVAKIVVRSTFNSLNPSTNSADKYVIPTGAFLDLDINALFELNTEI